MNNFKRNSAPSAADLTPDRLISALDKLADNYYRLNLLRAEKFHLTWAEARCLKYFVNERYLTVKGLALEMRLVKSRIVRIVQGLEQKALVKRFQHPQDKRICLLGLTAEGKNTLKDLQSCCREAAETIWRNLQMEQKETLPITLEQLNNCIRLYLPGN